MNRLWTPLDLVLLADTKVGKDSAQQIVGDVTELSITEPRVRP